MIVLHQIAEHVGGDERRESRPQSDVCDAQIEQRQKDADRLLLIPGENHGQGELVYTAAKGVRKRRCNFDGAEGIVALPYVHETGQAADGSQVQVVKAVFAAGQREHHRILRRLLHKLRVIVPAGTGAVASSNKEEMPDISGLHRFNNPVSQAKDRIVAKSCCHCSSPVDAGKGLILCVSAQGKGLLDNRRKVFISADMDNLRVGDHLRGKHPVRIAAGGRHQAVGRKENRGRDARKFLFLVLPGSAEISFQMEIFLQLRIPVSREHLAVCIHIDPFSLRLLKQQLQIQQVMPGDDDKGAFLHCKRHLRWNRRAEGLRVCLIQQLHAGKVVFSHLHDDRQQLFHAPVLPHGKQRLAEKPVQLLVRVAQSHGMVRIGRHAPYPEKDQGFQAANVLVGMPETREIVVPGFTAGGSAAGAHRRQLILILMDPSHELTDRIVMKIDVGDRGKQPFYKYLPCIIRVKSTSICGPGQPDQRPRQLILQPCGLFTLSAHALFPCTPGTSGCLFTLKAKHLLIHCHSPTT